MTLEQALLALKRIREAYRAWDAGRLEAEEALVAAAMSAGLPEKEARAAVAWGLEVGARSPLALDPPGFSANGGVFRKAVCGKPEPSPSQKSVFRKAAIYRIGGLRKRRGVV